MGNRAGNDMSLMRDLLARPIALSVASTYTAVNGAVYMATGALFLLWPGAVQTIFRDAPYAGHEEALIRVVGMMLAIIGWFYVFGARTGARSIVAASVVDRVVLVPAVLVPLALAGTFPHLLSTFAVLDPLLGIGAFVLLRRATA